MKQPLPRLLIALVGGLLLLNLFQAAFTELLYDEAYYWYYAQNPAWGYFDHPPMVAWMIGLGMTLFQGELGVRLVSCLMGAGTLLLLWKLIEGPGKKQRTPVFLVWFLSIPLLHAYGFLSLPDTPLLFFSTLFLLAYKRFLDRPGGTSPLWLGLAMAGLMYSKYHAALVILLVLLSNLKLLRSRQAWLALGISLLCYMPHLAWLYQQDFVTVRYHLSERPNQPYSFEGFTLGYLLNLVAVFGLTFPWVYRTLFRYRPADAFRRALVFIAWGILLFFFFSSFQRRVQTQWIIAACIPVAVIVGEQLLLQPGLRKWIWRAGLANLAVLCFLRIGLIYEPLFPVPFEAHGNKRWVASLEANAGDAPVVFENSYRQASMYQFYSGETSISCNNAFYRKNQYSIDGSEERVRGKRVFYIPVVDRETPYGYKGQDGNTKHGVFMEDFRSFRRLRAGIRPEHRFVPGSVARFWIYNPYDFPVPVSELDFGVAQLDAHKRIDRIRGVVPDSPQDLFGPLMPGDSLEFSFRVPASDLPPEYIRAVVRTAGLPFGLNGDSQKIEP